MDLHRLISRFANKKHIFFTLFLIIFSIISFCLKLDYKELKTHNYPVVNSVIDVEHEGIHIPDIYPEDVKVWVKTQVPFSLENAQIPLSLVLIKDKSNSMLDYFERQKLGMNTFLEQVKEKDKLKLYSFDRRKFKLQDWTSNISLIERSYQDLKAEGRTALYDTLYEVLEDLEQKQKEYTGIVLFSDGIDESYIGSGQYSKKDLDDVINKARHMEIPVHVISYGNRVEENYMKHLTEKTNGHFYNNPSYSMYEKIYSNITDSFNQDINLTHTSPFKDWYDGKRIVEIEVSKKGEKDSEEKSYIREGEPYSSPDVSKRDEVLQLMETMPKVTILATDRNNKLIDGNFQILVNGQVVDSGNIQNGSGVFDLKQYYFDEYFERTPDEYEKMRKKSVMFSPELKMLVWTTEADNQFIQLKVELESLDGKRKYEFLSTLDGKGTNKITQDILEGVYNLNIKQGNRVLTKDVVEIKKGRRLTRDYKFGRITLRKEQTLFSDRELSGLNVSIYDEYTGRYLHRDTPLYKVTGGQSHFLLPPGKYIIKLDNKNNNNNILKGKVEFNCIILGGESIISAVKREDLSNL
ncbi:MAG: vWA domain-containing protein [Candidatus Muiribacteriota bacterium]